MTDSLLISTLATIHNPWRANMYLNANTAVGVGGVIPFTTIRYDPANMCATGASAKITVPTDGYYLVFGSGQDITTSVAFYVEITQNGGAAAVGSDTNAAGTGIVSVGATLLKCAAGDYIQLINGPATTLVGSQSATWLSVTWIAPA